MASIKQTHSGTCQLCVKSKLLPKTLWATFDTRDAAEKYGAQLEGLLKQGIVPSALLQQTPPKPQSWTVGRALPSTCGVTLCRNQTPGCSIRNAPSHAQVRAFPETIRVFCAA
jgi:hypothetical protein